LKRENMDFDIAPGEGQGEEELCCWVVEFYILVLIHPQRKVASSQNVNHHLLEYFI
jgi:hypothetical protein